MTTILTAILLGSQLGMMTMIDTPTFSFRYVDASYVADMPSFWTTTRLDVSVRIGGDLSLGYAALNHQPVSGPSRWETAYSDLFLRLGTPTTAEVTLRPNGYDLAVAMRLSPTITISFFNWRYYGGAPECNPYCEWSGPVLTFTVFP